MRGKKKAVGGPGGSSHGGKMGTSWEILRTMVIEMLCVYNRRKDHLYSTLRLQ